MGKSTEKLYFSGDSFFAALGTAIHSAQKSIDIQCYIFAADQRGWAVVDDLKQAAAKGVQVRVLVDGVGSALALSYLTKALKIPGIELRVFHPLRLWTLIAGLLPWFGQSRVGRIFSQLNRRNHRKVFVVDQREAFLGSLNVSDAHLEHLRGAEAMHDVGLRLNDERLVDLHNDFNLIWRRSCETAFFRGRLECNRVSQRFGETLFLNTTLRQRWQVRARILQQIQAAKRTIFIANAYLVPDGRMLRALAKAALRGIDVRIMVSKHSDIVFMPYITSGFYGHLLRAGIRVYQFNPAFLHMKIMMIDDWALVGSSNLNHRSWLHDLEVDAVITDPQRRLELQKLFANNLKLCSQVSWLQLRQRPWWARVIGTLGYYMRFWI